jgi:hypothetical protein
LQHRNCAILNDDIVPKDLDVVLPFSVDKLFILSDFLEKIKSFGIECEAEMSEIYRYSVLFDKNRPDGAFSADIIQPFCSICHDMMDMDVNNLYVKKDLTKEIGMLINLRNLK